VAFWVAFAAGREKLVYLSRRSHNLLRLERVSRFRTLISRYGVPQGSVLGPLLFTKTQRFTYFQLFLCCVNVFLLFPNRLHLLLAMPYEFTKTLYRRKVWVRTGGGTLWHKFFWIILSILGRDLLKTLGTKRLLFVTKSPQFTVCESLKITCTHVSNSYKFREVFKIPKYLLYPFFVRIFESLHK